MTLKALLKKDFLLLLPKPLYLLLLLGCLTAVPNYPTIISTGYVIMLVFFVFTFSKENRDAEFTAMLPISRNDLVNARLMTVLILEIAQLTIAALFAIGGALGFPEGNKVGIDPNPTLFGTALLCLSAFNLIFFPLFYRTGYKSGVPMLFGLLAFLSVYAAVELMVNLIPGWRDIFDTLNPAMMGWQSIFPGVGVVAFVGLSFLTAHLSRKAFARADL